ncbi:GPR119.2 family protein [Megaselia abdita]
MSSISQRLLKVWHSRTVNIAIAPVYNPSRWKAIKIVLFTTGSYFITWFPFFFASALYAVCDPQRTPVYCDNLKVTIASVLTILGMCNSILNPIIYAWWHNGFRESVMKIYRSMWSKLFESKSQHYNKRHSGVSSRTNITHITESSRPISRDSNNLSEELNVPRLLHHSEMINGEARDVDVEEEQLNPRPSRKHVRIEEVDEDEEPKKEMEKDDRPYNETML